MKGKKNQKTTETIKHISDYTHAQLVPPDLSLIQASYYNTAENLTMFNHLRWLLNKTRVLS